MMDYKDALGVALQLLTDEQYAKWACAVDQQTAVKYAEIVNKDAKPQTRFCPYCGKRLEG